MTIVPKQAIVVRNGRQVVFTYDNGIARQHFVSLRHEAKGLCVVETTDKLDADSQLVVSGHETVTDGEKIVRCKK